MNGTKNKYIKMLVIAQYVYWLFMLFTIYMRMNVHVMFIVPNQESKWESLQLWHSSTYLHAYIHTYSKYGRGIIDFRLPIQFSWGKCVFAASAAIRKTKAIFLHRHMPQSKHKSHNKVLTVVIFICRVPLRMKGKKKENKK